MWVSRNWASSARLCLRGRGCAAGISVNCRFCTPRVMESFLASWYCVTRLVTIRLTCDGETGQFINVVVIFAKTCETLAVRERLIGRHMHIGHRRDSTSHHVTVRGGTFSEARTQLASVQRDTNSNSGIDTHHGPNRMTRKQQEMITLSEAERRTRHGKQSTLETFGYLSLTLPLVRVSLNHFDIQTTAQKPHCVNII